MSHEKLKVEPNSYISSHDFLDIAMDNDRNTSWERDVGHIARVFSLQGKSESRLQYCANLVSQKDSQGFSNLPKSHANTI